MRVYCKRATLLYTFEIDVSSIATVEVTLEMKVIQVNIVHHKTTSPERHTDNYSSSSKLVFNMCSYSSSLRQPHIPLCLFWSESTKDSALHIPI